MVIQLLKVYKEHYFMVTPKPLLKSVLLQRYLRSAFCGTYFVYLCLLVYTQILEYQILAKTTYVQKEAENVRVNTSLVMSSFWTLLETYHHISIQLLSSVNPPVYFWRNSHQSV